jgi:hypothetical protein
MERNPEQDYERLGVFELRQYTVHRGQAETLIGLFEREFIEPQEDVGAIVLGHFRDLDGPDRFVWVRGFMDMPARKQALESFYGGEVWARNRDEANATMVDSDDVLLLRPARRGSGFQPTPRLEGRGERGLVVATTYSLRGPAPDDLVELVDVELRQRLGEMGVQLLATLVTEPSANNFPRLPVRAGEHVLVWFALLPDRHSLASVERELEGWPEWQHAVHVLPSQRLRLEPARRSAIRWTGK